MAKKANIWIIPRFTSDVKKEREKEKGKSLSLLAFNISIVVGYVFSAWIMSDGGVKQAILELHADRKEITNYINSLMEFIRWSTNFF